MVYDFDRVMHPQEHAIRIAVASQHYRTVSGHAGKCRRFLVFEAEHGTAPREVERFDLPRKLTFREFAGDGPHPLDSVQAVIVASAGAGFIGRMAARGIEVITTSQTDPLCAATQYVAGDLSREENSERMRGAAEEATEFLKAMANETRLMILCTLLLGEHSVSELERKLELSQSRVSQQLARLRRAELVTNRPDGSTVYYSLSSPQVRAIVGALYEAHCDRSATRSPDGDLR